MAKKAAKVVPVVEWGYVVVTGGPYKGEVVYYDDNDGSNAICYPGRFLAGSVIIPKRLLRPASLAEIGNHQWENEELWPSARKRILREAFIEDIKMSTEPMPWNVDGSPLTEPASVEKQEGPRSIEIDIKQQFERAFAAEGADKRKQLLRLIVLATSWIELQEHEAGPTLEHKAAQAEARLNLGMS